MRRMLQRNGGIVVLAWQLGSAGEDSLVECSSCHGLNKPRVSGLLKAKSQQDQISGVILKQPRDSGLISLQAASKPEFLALF